MESWSSCKASQVNDDVTYTLYSECLFAVFIIVNPTEEVAS